ncbi:hypothetical protein [Thiolapillus sp.]
MKHSVSRILALSVCLISPLWAGSLKISNPGFEASPVKPVGWSVVQHAGAEAYETAIDDKVFREGKHSFSMQRKKKQIFGLLRQIVKLPKDSKVKTLHFSAMLRTEKVGKGGWGLVINFLAMPDERIISQARSTPLRGNNDWTRVEIVKPIPKGAGKLSIGVMLLDEGKGWMDDVKVEIR